MYRQVVLRDSSAFPRLHDESEPKAPRRSTSSPQCSYIHCPGLITEKLASFECMDSASSCLKHSHSPTHLPSTHSAACLLWAGSLSLRSQLKCHFLKEFSKRPTSQFSPMSLSFKAPCTFMTLIRTGSFYGVTDLFVQFMTSTDQKITCCLSR